MAVRIELRHLRYFIAVAEELHFGAAAQRLRIAQPSLSQQIRVLERELGVTLLDRGSRHVSLTPAGAVYLVDARAILANVGTATLDALRAARGEIGRLAIGFLGLTALDVLPPLLKQFRASYPDVTITLWEQSTEEQIRGVLDGSLDLGIVREPSLARSISSRHILRDAQIVALPSNHPLSGQKQIEIGQLREEGFILFPRTEGVAMYDRIIGACAKAGFSPRVVQEARIMTTMIGLVATGLGVAILPSVVERITHPSVVYRPLSPRLLLETMMIWDANTAAKKPSLKAFLTTGRPKTART